MANSHRNLPVQVPCSSCHHDLLDHPGRCDFHDFLDSLMQPRGQDLLNGLEDEAFHDFLDSLMSPRAQDLLNGLEDEKEQQPQHMTTTSIAERSKSRSMKMLHFLLFFTWMFILVVTMGVAIWVTTNPGSGFLSCHHDVSKNHPNPSDFVALVDPPMPQRARPLLRDLEDGEVQPQQHAMSSIAKGSKCIRVCRFLLFISWMCYLAFSGVVFWVTGNPGHHFLSSHGHDLNQINGYDILALESLISLRAQHLLNGGLEDEDEKLLHNVMTSIAKSSTRMKLFAKRSKHMKLLINFMFFVSWMFFMGATLSVIASLK